MLRLTEEQRRARDLLDSGKILNGGVGSGKSVVSLSYWKDVLKKSVPLYIITTAKKRDSKEWEVDMAKLGIDQYKEDICVDSWNRIDAYKDKRGCLFIFDEQRLVGSGLWVSTFLKISKNNKWIVLTATPGDVWTDYVPILVANGFYKNKTAFYREHVIFNPYVKFPMVSSYRNEAKIRRNVARIMVPMKVSRKAVRKRKFVLCSYDKEAYKTALKSRWDPFKETPCTNASQYVKVLTRIATQSGNRWEEICSVVDEHPRVIIFYNYNYELEKIRDVVFARFSDREHAEWNGHKHESIPTSDKWVYAVQYTAGAEGWNCTSTDTIIFTSLNYSYKIMEQAEGRIDRMNTTYDTLNYFYCMSNAPVEGSILNAIKAKKVFNAKNYEASLLYHEQKVAHF